MKTFGIAIKRSPNKLELKVYEADHLDSVAGLANACSYSTRLR